MKNTLKKGFTLIELIAVIIVIVILAAIALPRIGNMRGAANNAALSSDQQVTKTAIEAAITDGEISSATDANAVIGILTGTNSNYGGVPFLSKVPNVTVTGTFPSYSVN